MMTVPPRKILVICLRYLGDTLLLRPPLHALRAAHPAATIDALVSQGTGVALEGCPWVNGILEWPKRGQRGSELRLLARLLGEGYDWAVDFTGSDRAALAALASRARVRLAYERPRRQRFAPSRLAFNFRVPPQKPKPHILVQRLHLLEAAGIPSAGTGFGLQPDPVALEKIRQLTQGIPHPRLHIHPVSRDMRKALPARLVGHVAGHLQALGWGVTMSCGQAPVERAHAQEILRNLSRPAPVFAELSWKELLALIFLADKFWGADTAPAHLASALGIPARVEFGPSRADHWSPFGPGGIAAVHACACLASRSCAECPLEQPGRCMEAMSGTEVVKWVLAESPAQEEDLGNGGAMEDDPRGDKAAGKPLA